MCARSVRIPIALKLSPFFTALPNMARPLRPRPAPTGWCCSTASTSPISTWRQLEVVPNLTLSSSHDLRLPLRWIAMLYGRVEVDFALTGGVHTAEDVLKAMMAGANVAMLTSELLRQRHLPACRTSWTICETWMDEHEYESIAQMRGSMSQRAVAEPAAFERANYMIALKTTQ